MFQDGVELNWLPPTEPNGEVHYVIEYKREDSGNWTSVNTTSDSTHYNLTGLHNGTSYTIRVVAVSYGRAPITPKPTPVLLNPHPQSAVQERMTRETGKVGVSGDDCTPVLSSRAKHQFVEI